MKIEDISVEVSESEASPIEEAEDIAEEITIAAEVAYDLLLERREAALAAAIAPLDSETESLLGEHDAIEADARTLESLLPARAREAQREADVLTLAGKHEAARVKLREAQEAANAPAAMKARQREINLRLEALTDEKKVIAKRVFAAWYAELQRVIRAAERALFTELLGKGHDEMYAFQKRHGLGATPVEPYGFVKTGHLIGLTADEHSAEWQAGQRWYQGRR